MILGVLVLVGCGGPVGDRTEKPKSAGPQLTAFGMSIDLPTGWTGRIVIGTSGRPVLHAASFPLEANDTDDGEIAKEAMGIKGTYLNVRDIGRGEAASDFPLTFAASDFGPVPPGSGGVCCHLLQAAKEAAHDGELYRVTAVSGGDDPPSDAALAELNDALSTLVVVPGLPQPVEPASGEVVAGYGLHAALPGGWNGHVDRGLLEASDGSITLAIREHGAADAGSFVTGRMPILLGPAEFVSLGGQGYETGRSFVESGRDFVLSASVPTTPPDAASLEQANALLASFGAEAGDFYPGTVEPATFAPADGWDTGSSGRAQIQPDGQTTMSWASTIPYRDESLGFPPSRTLAALPPDGIVVLARLDQYGRTNAPAGRPPFRLSDFVEGSFEGLGPENSPRQLGVHVDDYDLQLWAFFGRAHPTAEQLARAQEELDRLQLPDWPAWQTR